MTISVTIVSRMPPERSRLVLSYVPEDFEINLVESSESIDLQIKACKDANSIILGAPNIDIEVLKQCPKVQLLQTLSAGYEELNLEGISKIGIPIANNGGSNAGAVSEQVISMALMLLRGTLLHWKNAKEKKWRDGIRDLSFNELGGKKIGIIGMGPIGKELAKKLNGFQCKLSYYDINFIDPVLEKELNLSRVTLNDLLMHSDIISLHIPLNEKTYHFIGKKEFEAMKKNVIIINTSRGGIIDENALRVAINNGDIAGAGLDVMESEPAEKNEALLELDNVIITPHMAGVTSESNARSAIFAFENIRKAIEKKEILSVVNTKELLAYRSI
jgi:phosphoglycerate dehydrogenase-like enzyme